MEERDWEKAHREGRRIFYEKATVTMRTCPENYLVALVASVGFGGEQTWRATPDAAIQTPTKEEIQKILDSYRGNPPWVIAQGLEKELSWPRNGGRS